MARFFIDRPIFAWVLAIIVMMAGALALNTLPRAQYPNIAPPQISVTSIYPGASAKTVEDTVTQVIEQQMKGIDNLAYMSAYSDSTGQSELTLTFDPGTNPDIAQVQVQNKLQLATPLLPEPVQRQGIVVAKATSNYLLVLTLHSEDGSMDQADISDFLASTVQDPVSRLPGVGDMSLFGAQYSMRIWLDPVRMREYKLNPDDVANAIQAQNAQVPGGQIGGAPAVKGQQINITVIAAKRLETVKQFENILLRVNEDGSSLYLRDIARVEIGSENYSTSSRMNRHPAAALGIKLASGANALETADVIKQEVESLSTFFPAGLKVTYPYDTSPFVRISIKEVFKTLAEAIVLVFLVMYLFLQDFRATLIPTIAVPVVLLGTFAVLSAAGFSINTLTMFGMVLAIGLLVDDAIVVVENVERVMREEKLSAIEAARVSMDQITGALVGVGMVLSAVFLPMAFFGGSTGVIYRQFSITIISAMVLSVFVALSLTPALCSTMLHPHGDSTKYGFFGRFNRWFERLTNSYQSTVHKLILAPMRYLLLFLAAIALLAFMFLRLPTSFLPSEDQGLLFIGVQMDAAATFGRTDEVVKIVEDHFLEKEKDSVSTVLLVSGFAFNGSGQNVAFGFVRLKDWDQREDESMRADAIAMRANRAFYGIPNARVFAFAPPAVLELGTANGFDFELIDRGNRGHEALIEARNKVLYGAMTNPDLISVRPNGLEDVEQYELELDLVNAGAMGLGQDQINSAVATYWGGQYVNDFMDKGRIKKVYMQADSKYRMQAADFERYYAIRNANGDMVDFSSFLKGKSVFGSPKLERYNGVPSVEILGEAAPGKSSGQAMDIMEQLVRDNAPGYDFSWTALSYQERLSGSQAPALYAISMIIVFLCLAALYESWSIPFAVLLVAPIGVMGALTGAYLRGLSNDVYFQVGLLTTIGLAAKNAILIVEFARELEQSGQDLVEATLHAVRMRLRPIIMTSMAFILGVLPLAISSGAGSGGQNAIGTAVMAGMIFATLFGIFYIPIFFVVVSRLFKATLTKTGTGENAHA